MKQQIIFISSVKFGVTPILEYTKRELEKNYICTKIEYSHKKIFRFLFDSISCILKSRNKTALFFVGAQSLPLLFIFQFFYRNRIYYWALESYRFKLFKSPLAIKTLFFTYLIAWHRIYLLVPSKYRLDFFGEEKFKKAFIVWNCSPSGNSFIKRKIEHPGKIKLVMYGRLNNSDVFPIDFIDFCVGFKNQLELHLIGWDFENEDYVKGKENIYFHGFKEHDELVKMLESFHYSIIGYRPFDYNNKYCAPNKLYEAFSLSLPVIVNSNNPPLVDIIEEHRCGIAWDFENLNIELLKCIEESFDNYALYIKNSYELYMMKYNSEIALWDLMKHFDHNNKQDIH